MNIIYYSYLDIIRVLETRRKTYWEHDVKLQLPFLTLSLVILKNLIMMLIMIMNDEYAVVVPLPSATHSGLKC